MWDSIVLGLTIWGITMSISLFMAKRYLRQYVFSLADEYIQTWLTDEEKKKALQEILGQVIEKIKQSIVGTKGGVMSAISRQLQSTEAELIKEGVNAATGLPIGNLLGKRMNNPLIRLALEWVMKNPEILKGQGLNKEGSSESW